MPKPCFQFPLENLSTLEKLKTLWLCKILKSKQGALWEM